MVGLSVLLESRENGMCLNRRRWTKAGQIINQTASIKSTAPAFSYCSGFVVGAAEERDQFLHQCFLCKHKLLENENIYMYMGEKAFCSEDCRLEHMNMETYNDGGGQQQEELEQESGGRSSEKNVKKVSLFSADCSPPRHEKKNGYKTRAHGRRIAC